MNSMVKLISSQIEKEASNEVSSSDGKCCD